MITSYSPTRENINYSGKIHKDVAKKIEAPTRHEAMVLFENAKKRLNDINNWTLFCGKSPADFQLTDEAGNLLNSPAPKLGNIIKVRCHAPSADSKNNYIWYKIESFIHEKNLLKDTEDFGFTAVQISDPSAFGSSTYSITTTGVTCAFLVIRTGCVVSAIEVETTKMTGNVPFSVFSKLKNRFSVVFDLINPPQQQWKNLVNGVLHY